ncbi:hypothetical protein DelCs14_1790 [Delftia sp. Cs1-4]|uniref:hypothetical protein n=1 Tax=Delftia sp. (strain Cs1-4) TaxID=742013 RepID=UPI00020E7BE0|nr:hypothetical protein [Delftia sp. Cs1-4]AEF88815.1 hypothetical protein DelCs14_1790 [Delftia sp. Cs1-4]
MTLKALAHDAHLTLQARTGRTLPRSHVYELLAAALGSRSWAAFLADSLLADAGVGVMPDGALARVCGRARQLGHAQSAADALTGALIDLATRRQMGAVRWDALAHLMRSPPSGGDERIGRGFLEDEDEDEEDEEEDGGRRNADAGSEPAHVLSQERVLSSPLLLDSLERAAAQDARAHHALAAIHRCAKPNPYLYEESLKGRVLTAAERGWVEDYLRLAPRYRRYEKHLRTAAEGGVRAAALEYGAAFERPEFIELAERLAGEVDALQMARSVGSPQARNLWLRRAAEAGSRQAVEALAAQGDAWAEDRMAAWAGSGWLRAAARRSLDQGDAVRAWTWQYVALARGEDLTASTLTARHDGGTHDGQFYDSDFGGPLYVDGDEGLSLPELGRAGHEEATAAAGSILAG